MDTVTQAALGAVVGQAGFRKQLGNKAIIFGALCGTIPDWDAVSRVAGDFAFLVHHRGITHSLPVLALCSPLIGWLGYRWGDRKDYWVWVHLTFWALITHPLLDICTSYGTQIFYPFSSHRFALDSVAVIDPIYSFALALSLFLVIPKTISDKWKQNIAWIALVFTTLYLAFGFMQNCRAREIIRAELQKQEISYIEIRATPTLLTNLLWRVLVRDKDNNIYVGGVSTLAPQTIKFHKLAFNKHPLAEEVRKNKYGKIFDWFAEGWVTFEVDKAKVYAYDQRFGLVKTPKEIAFKMFTGFDENNRLEECYILDPQYDFDISEELNYRWDLLWGK